MQILCPTGFLAELISSKSVNVSTWISSKTDVRLSMKTIPYKKRLIMLTRGYYS